MVRTVFVALVFGMSALSSTAQMPPVEPGVSLELAKWRAERYSDVRYKLNLTLEKMSPVLKGTIEIRVKVSEPPASAGGQTSQAETRPLGSVSPIILDWRKIIGHEDKSTISNVTINGTAAVRSSSFSWPPVGAEASPGSDGPPKGGTPSFAEHNEHLIFRDGVVMGENVIKLDFTSPILTSGSAITRYVDKEDGAEYIYSLFVPSDASTAFPVFDQPDLKARFTLNMATPRNWTVVANVAQELLSPYETNPRKSSFGDFDSNFIFNETKPISTYVFAFAAGPFERMSEPPALAGGQFVDNGSTQRGTTGANRTGTAARSPNWPAANAAGSDRTPPTYIYVRKSQAEKFRPHAAEVFRLNREAIKYFEEYFDYKFPFPKYDLVLIPEFPFGGMEHAGATFLRESSIIFPQEPTRNDHISRALLIFHEASHQWFGDTVTMRWFDDLWLKEGFATFTAYKAMERIMPEMMAWKVFYERVKQAAYQTDSTKGTTPIYQEIPNLSAAKSAYGNIVYNKAPAFLRQADFYLGEDKFQTAVRAFLEKHEFGNAGWEDLVEEFEVANGKKDIVDFDTLSEDEKRRISEYEENLGTNLTRWAQRWVIEPEVYRVRIGKKWPDDKQQLYGYFYEKNNEGKDICRPMKFRLFVLFEKGKSKTSDVRTACDPLLYDPGKFYLEAVNGITLDPQKKLGEPLLIFPNYGDYGYGIFLLDEKSRDYVLKNIQNEKDPFLRSMMWGALWDSVREGELDPRTYIELVIKNFPTEKDETMTSSILGRATMALNYYVADKTRNELVPKFESGLIDRLTRAETAGQRITIYRALLNVVATASGQDALKAMLEASLEPQRNVGPKPFTPGLYSSEDVERILRFEEMLRKLPLKTKDKFDIVTRLLILGDPDAPKLLAELEKTETSDDAKRYAYAARAGIATAENKAKYWKDFTEDKEISESWIEAAFGPWNSIRHSELTLPYLQKALQELPNHKRNRKIFFVNGWLGAFVGGQRSEEALGIINKFLADNPQLDNDLRLKILENADIIERAVKIRSKYAN